MIMWIMGYNNKDGVESMSNNIQQDPAQLFNGRRNEHRPLMPRTSITTAFGSSPQSFNNPSITASHDHLLALNHYHLAMAEHNRRELLITSTQQVVVSSRWNPTPEQLQALEEIYRRGTRTPSAEQIQQITAQLRRFGKIEGKNVFYWFQNHKARERQKRRRRQVEPSSDEQQQQQQQQQPHYNNNISAAAGGEEDGAEKIESMAGANGASYEVEETYTKNRPSKSITTSNQKTLSLQGATTKAAERKSHHGWVQLFDVDDGDSPHQMRNATWHAMQLPCNSSNSSPTNPVINSCSVAATTVATIPSTVAAGGIITASSKQIIQDSMARNVFYEPYYDEVDDDDEHQQAQTLQLFPLRNDGGESVNEEESVSAMLSTTTTTSASLAISPNYQFFEFLPLKN